MGGGHPQRLAAEPLLLYWAPEHSVGQIQGCGNFGRGNGQSEPVFLRGSRKSFAKFRAAVPFPPNSAPIGAHRDRHREEWSSVRYRWELVRPSGRAAILAPEHRRAAPAPERNVGKSLLVL